MNKFEAVILGLVVLLVSAGSCMAEYDDRSKLIVSGTGEATATPDMVTVVLGVETKDESANVAATRNAQLTTDTIDALIGAGVNKEDIKTTRYTIYPRRDWIDGKPSEKVEFEVSNQITFTMDLINETDVGVVLDAAVSAGTNTVNSVSFGLRDPAPLMEEALKDAIANARKKADVISGAAGVSLGKILTISEGGPSPIPNGDVMYLRADALGASTPIVPGDVEVSAGVSLIYEIL